MQCKCSRYNEIRVVSAYEVSSFSPGGRCAREFTRANLRELTVHHRDHNHDNNPPDGSSSAGGRASTYAAFADLKKLLAKKQPPK